VNVSSQSPDKRRILIPHQWNAERGLYGADKVLLRILKEIAPIAEPLVVVESEGELTTAARGLGCDVVVRPMGVLRRKKMNPAGLAGCAWQIVASSFWMARQIRRRNIQMVLTSTVSVIPGALAARMTQRPHLWFVEEFLGGSSSLLSIIVSMLSTRILAVSEASARSIHRGRKGARRKTAVAYPGVEPPPPDGPEGEAFRRQFSAPERPLLIGMVGRLHHWKGQEYFFDALCELKKRNIGGFRALLVGDAYRDYPEWPERLRQKSRALGLEQEVVFCGHRNDVYAVYRGLDIAVAPSTRPEPFGLVVAEAMSAELPVIATAWGGPAEVIEDGISGFLVPTGDPVLFSARLEQLIRDPGLRRQMGRRARQRVESAFSAAAFNDRIRREIRELTAP
jgi:glycosyltransferase involved in cell wall biosynthesis